MSTPESLPNDLPWQSHAYLLLDGVSVSNVRARVSEWFGMPDVISNGWHSHTRPKDSGRGVPDGPYGVCEAQQAKLDGVKFRAGIRLLDDHLNAKIPEYRFDLTGAARWQWLREMAIRADGLGFSSDHDLCFYANVYGLLGDDVLRDHPDIAALITQPSELTPSDRIKKAADLALLRNGNYEVFV